MTAAALAVLRRFSGNITPTAFEAIDRLWFAAAYGLSLGAVLVMIARRRRGIAFPTEPGEYYLVATGIGDTLFLACWAAYEYLLDPLPGGALWMFYFGCLLNLIPDFWATIGVTDPGWRQLMRARLALKAVQAMLISSRFDADLVNQYWIAAGIEIVVTICWLPILWQQDRQRQIQRGWLHALGALCWFLSCLHALGWWVWAYSGRV